MDYVSFIRKLGTSEKKSIFIFSEEDNRKLQVAGSPCSGRLPDLIDEDVDSVLELVKDSGVALKLKKHEVLFPRMNAKLVLTSTLLGDWHGYLKLTLPWFGFLFASAVSVGLSILWGLLTPSVLLNTIFGLLSYLFATAVFSIIYWATVRWTSRSQRYVLVLGS